MRGADAKQESFFSYVSPEERVPDNHPLRTLRELVNTVLTDLSPEFGKLYAHTGRPSIAPEKLLRALLLQILYTIRSERLLMEQLDYNLLFRWFVGLHVDDPVWDATVFTKNRDRLLEGDIAGEFFDRVLSLAKERNYLSDEHFTVDGTIIEAWASHKSFQAKEQARRSDDDDPGNATVDFRGQKRSNATHQSTTDPQARLYRKSSQTQSQLCYQGHVCMENRHGLVVDTRLTQASGRAEPEAAVGMAQELPGTHRKTLGMDKYFDNRECVRSLRQIRISPHVAQNTRRWGGSAIDSRTTRHPGYALSQRARKRVEEIFGWLKTVGLMRKTRHRGVDRVGWMFTFSTAVYNLVRIRNLILAGAGP